jgi:hypothetical protein
MREFAKAINLAAQTNQKIPHELFAEVLISTLYRLEVLSYQADQVQEAVRLGMLSVSTTIFLAVNGVPVKYDILAAQFRSLLQPLKSQGSTEKLKFTLWLLFVGKTSSLSGPEDAAWLEQLLYETSLSLKIATWHQAREVLKNYIWVDVAHDTAGKQFFHTIPGRT